MGWPVVTVASGGMPVVDVTATTGRGTPVTEATNKSGAPVTKVTSGGMAVAYETIGIAPPPAPTTLNPADKDSHITLSGNNLIATGTAGWTSNVRAVASHGPTGKYYWECTCSAIAASQSGVGVAIGGTILTAGIGTFMVAGMCGLSQQGNVFRGNAAVLTGLGTITNGTVICVALDIANNLIWFRYGAAGIWNNNASNNPATGVGGVAPFGAASVCYPMVGFGGADQITANFGGSAFTGAAPSGFNSGWPA